MKNRPLFIFLLLLLGCSKDFEPDLSGWEAYTRGGRLRLYLSLDGRKKEVVLPGDASINYRFVQWTKSPEELLIVQTRKTEVCYDYRLLSIDTTGAILDTVYSAPPNTLINFRLAPNDSLLLLKTYIDACDGDPYRFRYSFFNRHTKKSLSDTLIVTNAAGIPLHENIWSPNSRKVLILEWSGLASQAYVYDLLTGDTTWIETGRNFLWSPKDNQVVAYIKDHSLYARNLQTGETALIYKGKKKKSVTGFRWNPSGEFMMIYIRSYFLNIEAPPTQNTRVIYYSPEEQRESESHLGERQVDTWRTSPVAKRDSLGRQ
jgi:hypothetical protein